LILSGERFGSQTRIATESVSLADEILTTFLELESATQAEQPTA